MASQSLRTVDRPVRAQIAGTADRNDDLFHQRPGFDFVALGECVTNAYVGIPERAIGFAMDEIEADLHARHLLAKLVEARHQPVYGEGRGDGQRHHIASIGAGLYVADSFLDAIEPLPDGALQHAPFLGQFQPRRAAQKQLRAQMILQP